MFVWSNETYYLNEGLFQSEEEKELFKNWKTHNDNHKQSEFSSSTITDEEYMKLKDIIHTLRNEEDYKVYKSAFDKLCRFCHVVPRGVIITKLELKKGKGEYNSLLMKYSYNTRKISLPEDVDLYHMSEVDDIKELKPFFRGKSQKGYLYDKPRIYFTIKKTASKIIADYNPMTKTHTYKCKERIKDAYVDPLLTKNFQGAVYIETDKPITVEKIDPNMFKKDNNKENDNKKESIKESTIDAEALFEFVNEFGLELESIEV